MSSLFSRRSMRASALVLAASLGLAVLGGFGSVNTLAQTSGEGISRFSKSTGKLTPRLETLAQPAVRTLNNAAQASTLSLPETGAGSLLRGEAGEPLVYIRLSSVDDASVAALRDAGARVVHVANEYNTVTAYVAPERLTDVAAISNVQNIREELTPLVAGHDRAALSNGVGAIFPQRPVAQAGCATAITSEGDTQLKANQARTTYGVNGAGVTVGVLSDSFGKTTSPKSVQQDIASGDLPGPGNPCGRLTATNVISETTASDATDEGRAMVQIVHDLAPEAKLAFATANEGLFDFAANIVNLRNQANADVIVDDISYFVEPFYQDGPITQAINQVTTQGATYFTSAGNSDITVSGRPIASYEAPAYRPVACPALPNLPPQDKPATCHSFNPTATDATSSYTLAPNGYLQFIFQWAQPWFGVSNDFDIYLTNASGSVIAGSASINSGTNGTQVPYEAFSYQNISGATQTVYLVIGRYSGTAAPRLKTLLIGGDGITATEYSSANNSTDTFGPTIFGHSAATNALSIAAVPYNNSATPESYTSRGPALILYGPTAGTTPAAALAAPSVRNKPDVAATDGGRNTFFGSFVGGVWRFYGTSAAAPHAAAVTALAKQRALQTGKLLFQSTAEKLLESTAASIANGSQPVSGAGLVNALAAVGAVDALPQTSKVVIPLASFGKKLGGP